MKNKKRFALVLAAAVLISTALLPAQAVINGIFLGSDKNGVNILNDRLRPGEEYLFPVLVAADGTPPVQLTSADLGRNRLEVRVVSGGKAVQSVAVEESEGLVYLSLTAGSRGTLQELEAKLRLNYRTQDSGQNITVTPTLRVGYNPMPDDVLAALDPGEHLIIDPQYPVISSRQWETLASLNDHRPVILQGGDWRYEAYVTGLGKRNMTYDHQPVAELVKKFPNPQLHFLSCPGAPDFEVTGQLTLDVLALAEAYNHDFYLYRCAYGKLYPLKFDYDKDAAEISFRPSQLSTYLLTDRRSTLVDNQPTDSSNSSSGQEAAPPMANPDTGAPAGSLMAWVVSLVSLAGLGALSCGNRKR